MKKTLIALAVLAASGAAFAQSNVTIYGNVDVGYAHVTGDKLAQQEDTNNRIGFKGSEDLGGGLKAVFQLEARFNGDDGTQKGSNTTNLTTGKTTSTLFDGASNVGLAGSFGQVVFGRMNSLAVETVRTFDPFNEYGVTGLTDVRNRSARISNSVRFDSANYSGFSFGGTYTLQEGENAAPASNNDGYEVALKYNNGPLSLGGVYQRNANDYDSTTWNIGAGYWFGPFRLSALYQEAVDKAAAGAEEKNKQWLIGGTYKIGSGEVHASYANNKIKNSISGVTTVDDDKLSIGYTHFLSKRTSVYAEYANTNSSLTGVANVNGYNVGLLHKF